TSHRNSSVELPRTSQVLASEKSTFANPGPITLFRRALPNVNGAGSVNADVSNQRSGVRAPEGRLASPRWFGRCAGPAPMLARSPLRFAVNGAPDCAVK